MNDQPTGIKTNGKGETVDWMNLTRSLADVEAENTAAVRSVERKARRMAIAGNSPGHVTWRGKPVSMRNAALLWGQR